MCRDPGRRPGFLWLGEQHRVAFRGGEAMSAPSRPALSFVIPFLNEEATLETLYERIAENARGVLRRGETFEVIFVDDGSTDGSVKAVERLAAAHPEVVLLELQGNFGKSAEIGRASCRERVESRGAAGASKKRTTMLWGRGGES